MSIIPLIDARAWHDKVSIQTMLPGMGIMVIDRTPLQARRLAQQLNEAAAAADAFAAQAIDEQAIKNAQALIDADAKKTLRTGPAERRLRAAKAQGGSALLTVIDIMAGVGVIATSIGFALRALTLTA